MYGDGGTLKSLHGVSQHLINKLQEAGIQSISDLAATTTSELLEDYYSNYDDGHDNQGQTKTDRGWSSLQRAYYCRRHA
jgi:hypothetical protein